MAIRDISMTTEQTPSMVEDFALSSSVFENLVKTHSQSNIMFSNLTVNGFLHVIYQQYSVSYFLVGVFLISLHYRQGSNFSKKKKSP